LVAVDSVEVGKIESGDLLIPLQERGASAVPTPRFPAIEMADIIAGKRSGRTDSNQITIFKSNGLALEDIAVAGYVYGEALQRGIGQRH
jgi:ornithine cyclodeaminase